MNVKSKKNYLRLAAILCLQVIIVNCAAQNIPIEEQKFIFFPHSSTKGWTTSVGVTAATLPRDIFEEFNYRVPAGDVHVVKKLSSHFNLHGRMSIQIFQNLVTTGPQWNTALNDRFALGVGNQVGYWFGFVNFAGFKSRGSGWQSYPNASIGYRFNRQVLLTLRAEAMMDFGIKTYAGKERVTTDHRLLSGSAYSIILEQPFFGNKNLVLGLRGMYTDFYWQTWASFESFDRNIFYPQVIIGVIL